MTTKEIPWHNISCREVIEKNNSDAQKGLSEKEAKERQQRSGKNLLPQEKPLSKIKIIWEQFKSPLVYILVIAGIIVLFFKEYSDAIVIFGAVFLNTTVGFFQENKASEALRKLKKIIKIDAQVVRGGNIKLVDSGELVPGDIFILKPGDKVPADGRIIEVDELKTNEMSLTGEWLPCDKTDKILPQKTPLADRDNMVYMGTVVEDGRAKIVTTATGAKTEIGKVAHMVKEMQEEKTPLQKRLSRFARIVGIIILIICAVIFIEGIARGNGFLKMFTMVVAVSVAAIPEGLPVALTVILALGMQRILKRKGLVRKLLAAETLGSTSIICSDKTKTLTEGRMQVSEIITGKELIEDKKASIKDRSLALKIAGLANEAFIENPEETMEKWVVRGRPTDKALLLAAIEAGINRKELMKKFPKLIEFPFDSTRKYIAEIYQLNKNEQILYVAGAPEKLLYPARYIEIAGKQRRLNSALRQRIEGKLDELASKGLRVVAVGYRKIKMSKLKIRSLERINENLTFVGVVALKDPLRKEVKEAIKVCRTAGMEPIIITGDHKLTAKAIAQEIGIKAEDKNIMEGMDLDKISDKKFAEKVKDIKVYARVEPRHKLRIVQAWQENGEVVAMTGDGINDVPALKRADIGMALGSGVEVAKEVSDLVLLTDNFNIIVAAVEEGRAIIDNIRKVITYLLSDSFTETILVGMALLFKFPLPVTAGQILWVNLIEDGLPSIALAFEPKEDDLMEQKPQKVKSSLLTQEMKVLIFVIGFITDFVLLGLFFWLFKNTSYEIEHIRSIIFTALAIDSIFYVFSCRSLRKNLWHINIFSNKLLVFAWIFSVIMIIVALYLPPLQMILKTVPLDLFDWILLFGLGLLNLILIEVTKWLFISRKNFF